MRHNEVSAMHSLPPRTRAHLFMYKVDYREDSALHHRKKERLKTKFNVKIEIVKDIAKTKKHPVSFLSTVLCKAVLGKPQINVLF